MPKTPPKFIHLVHELPGRLRLLWLHDVPAEAAPLADRLAALPGMAEVRCRPFTGSVLCRYDPRRLACDDILAAVRAATGVTIVVRPGEEAPAEDEELLRIATEEGNDVARAAAQLFKNLNLDLLRFTEGRTDLGTAVALGLALTGAVEVAVTRKLPAPPWFNLAWWAFRTFTTLEKPAIDKAQPDLSQLDLDTPEMDDA